MHKYDQMKSKYGNQIGQTIDSPILFFDHFDLWDMGLALAIVMLFGVIMYSWWTMIGLLLIFLGIVPFIKKNNNRGIFIHWFYRKIGISLPGLINPGKHKKYSD